MANIASSKKDARRSAVRAVRNRSLKSSVKTKVTRFRRAAEAGAEEIVELAGVAVAGLDRAVAKGILHRNNAARRKSRLMKRLAEAGAVAAGTAEAKPKAPAKGTAKAKAKPKAGSKAAAKAANKPAAKAPAKGAPAKTTGKGSTRKA